MQLANFKNFIVFFSAQSSAVKPLLSRLLEMPY